ncbi:RNA dependent RNA polymerase-domain-containing protein [Cladochytrium replicatum]|nr:RNA dependent RNA polymerase-domain-containing protein [Cladochytrium replicatum]
MDCSRQLPLHRARVPWRCNQSRTSEELCRILQDSDQKEGGGLCFHSRKWISIRIDSFFPPKCRIFNPYCLFAITKKQMESTKGCILIRAADRNDKLKALGLHGPKLSLAKRAKYAGLLFNNYRPIFELENVRIEKVDDVKVNGYNFTDGSGLVSMDVAEEMIRGHAVHSADHEYREHRPSIFQVRLPGVKGVLVADPTLPNRTIRLRPSMIKLDVLSLLQFDTEAQMYKRMPCHVVGFARPAKAYTTINHQVLALLVQRGVKVDSILKLEKHYFDSVRYMTLSPAYALNYLWLTGKFSLLEALIKDIVSLSVIASERAVQKIWNRIATWQKSELADWRKPDRAPTPSQRAAEFQAQQSSSQDTANLLQTQSSVLIPPDPFAEDSKLMYRVRLPVRGVSVYGCADHTGQLKPGECYLQVTWAGVDKPTVLSGKVMVFRFPSYHPNDIRILTAVEKPPSGLENVADVIVFPTNGTRPHPDEMSGGDLDGDKFSVIWDDMLFPDDGPGCEPFHYDAGKMAALVVSAISARVPQEPLPYQNLSKPKKTAAHFHEELVDFLTTLPNHYAVVQVDSVMRLWQRLSHPAAPAQIQDVLVSMFNVGIDHTAPSDGRGKSILNPENVKALLNVLTSKIGKHAVGPSEVSDLDEKLMTEINDCVHSTQKRKHSLLQPIFKLNVDSAMEDIIALYAKSNRGDFQSPASSDLLVWTREKLMVAPTLRIVYEDFPITVELQDEVDLARHALRAAGSKIVEIEQSALGASGWMPVELASQISETFGSDRAKRCVELLQALEGDLKKLASNNSLILQLVSTWATLAEPVDLAEQNLRRAKKDKDREDKDREDDAELIVRLGEELNAARAKFKDWINNSTRDYLRERGKESDKNTRIEMQARLIAKVNGIVEKVRVYTGRGSDFVSELHKITSAFITRVQCFGSAERHLRDLSGLVDIECHLMGKGYFPVYDRRAEIHRAIDFLDDKDESQRARRILLLVAQTGSGKSTIAPQFIVNARILAGQASFRRRVVVAQPRRVAATSVAQHVAGIRNTTLGAEVGYHIGRMGRAVVKQGETLLEFVTYGILLARSASDPSFTSFSVVVVDEVHEAGMELYLLLGSLRRALDSNASLRVVLMSAAVDEKKLIDFFGNDVDRGRLKDDMDLFEDKDLQKAKLDDIIRNAALPVTEPKNENKPNTGQSSVPESRNRQTTDLGAVALVRVTTATYPVEVYYGIKSDSNYVEVCVEKCIEIHIANHDILKRTREILLEDPNTTAVSMNKQSKSSKKNKKKKKGKKTESDKEVSEERGTIQAEVAVKDDADASKPGSSKVPVPDVDDDDEAMTPEKEERMTFWYSSRARLTSLLLVTCFDPRLKRKGSGTSLRSRCMRRSMMMRKIWS